MRILFAFVILAVFALASTVASSYAASGLAPHSLPRALIVVKGVAIHWPWRWFEWSVAFGDHPPRILQRAELIAYLAPLPVIVLVALCGLGCARRLPVSTVHGSARWSTRKELERAGLFCGDGVVLCQTADAEFRQRATAKGETWDMIGEGTVLCDASESHVMGLGPSGSGKTAGMVIPTLLTWRHSAVLYDPKGELWSTTSGWRRQFSHCLRFNPADPESVCHFNPLFEIRRGIHDMGDAQLLADVCGDPEGSKEKEDHWDKSAKPLLAAAMLHVLYAGKVPSLAGVLEFLSMGEDTTDLSEASQIEVLDAMARTQHLEDGPHPEIVKIAHEYARKSPNELSGVFSTVLAALGVYRDPVVARNTNDSSFSIEQLTNLRAPVSLYLVIPIRDAKRLRPLVRVVLNHIGLALTDQLDGPRNRRSGSRWSRFVAALRRWADRTVETVAKSARHLVLYGLEEFPTLGPLPFLEAGIAYLRGFGVKIAIYAQSLKQIEARYGKNHAFLDNTRVRVSFTAQDDESAEKLSRLLGQRTVSVRQQTRSRKPGSLWANQISETIQTHGRPLMDAEQIMNMPYDDALVTIGGHHPYLGKKVMYYQDARFRERASIPAPDRAAQLADRPPQPACQWRTHARPNSRVGDSTTVPLNRDRPDAVDPRVTAIAHLVSNDNDLFADLLNDTADEPDEARV